MSGQTPFFMSGPRLLIKIDGIKVAYAVGLDLRVSRNVQVVNTLGSFASVAIQATMYNGVSGSMQIVRLMDKESRSTYGGNFVDSEKKALTGAALTAAKSDTLAKASPAGSLSGIASDKITNNSDSDTNTIVGATQTLQRQLDPASVLASSTFDIEVWQLYPTTDTVAATPTTDTVAATPTTAASEKLNNKGKLVKHFTIQNCRLNSRSASISAGQLLTESFSFTGTLLISEDRDGIDDTSRESSDSSAFGSGA
jgi:hypothetical protein